MSGDGREDAGQLIDALVATSVVTVTVKPDERCAAPKRYVDARLTPPCVVVSAQGPQLVLCANQVEVDEVTAAATRVFGDSLIEYATSLSGRTIKPRQTPNFPDRLIYTHKRFIQACSAGPQKRMQGLLDDHGTKSEPPDG